VSLAGQSTGQIPSPALVAASIKRLARINEESNLQSAQKTIWPEPWQIFLEPDRGLSSEWAGYEMTRGLAQEFTCAGNGFFYDASLR